MSAHASAPLLGRATALHLDYLPNFVQCTLFAEADKTKVSLPGKPVTPE